jgi:hypothetical protein
MLSLMINIFCALYFAETFLSSFSAEDTSLCHFFGEVQFLLPHPNLPALSLLWFKLSHLLLSLYIPSQLLSH